MEIIRSRQSDRLLHQRKKVESMKMLRLVLLLGPAVAVLCGVPVASAETDSVPGWTITNTTGRVQDVKSCVATWNNNGPNQLAIEALGGLLTLTISSATFDQDKREEIISLGKTGTEELRRTARAAARTYGVTIDDEVDALLEKEGSLVLTIKGNVYSFSVPNIPSAIDAVLRCVGEPTKAELAEKHRPTFSLPAGWESLDMLQVALHDSRAKKSIRGSLSTTKIKSCSWPAAKTGTSGERKQD
jgi:hypothetical protein